MPPQHFLSVLLAEKILLGDRLLRMVKDAEDCSLQSVDDIGCLAFGKNGSPELEVGEYFGTNIGDLQGNCAFLHGD